MWNQVRLGAGDMTPGHLKPEIKNIFIIIITIINATLLELLISRHNSPSRHVTTRGTREQKRVQSCLLGCTAV
jgi:hypothetical protein